MDADPPSPTLETPPKAEETDADKIKEAGNVAFKARKFDDAIALYTKAIGAHLLSLISFPDERY